MIDLTKIWDRRVELVSRLSDMLSARELEDAKRDPHATRLPRPCGLTIHTGLGCKFGCLYCYIYDMGFSMAPRPYPLSGLQLAYAIALNPSVALGSHGTLMAFGSVTEPFMEETLSKSLEYLDAVARFLGNPIQFSTKAWIDDGLAARLGSLPDRVSALVTIVTTSLHEMLEPGAPDPERRFQSMSALSRCGIHTCLFLRPILPGLSEKEIERILARAMDSGAVGVVSGSMRVTSGIIRRLEAAGYPHMNVLKARTPGDLKPGEQVALSMSDFKKRIVRLAEDLGLRVYPSACAANIEAHGLACAACKLGPCGDASRLPDIDERNLRELSMRYGISLDEIVIDELKVFLVARGPERRIAQFRELVKSACKRMVVIRR